MVKQGALDGTEEGVRSLVPQSSRELVAYRLVPASVSSSVT